MTDGWLLRFDATANTLEPVVGTGATLASDPDRGLTALAAGGRSAVSVLAEYRDSGNLAPSPGSAAIAVHDAPAARLVAARDRTGLYPLFHTRAGSQLLLGTDARSLLAQPDVRAKPSRIAVAAWLVNAPLQPEETLLDGFERVPAGHVLEAGANGTRLAREWLPPKPGSLPARAAQEFSERLEAAIARLVGDARCAVFLSGGIDSSSVAAAATAVADRAGSARPLALCVDFEGASEREIQLLVSRQLDLERFEATLSPQPDLLERGLNRSGESLWPTPAVWAPVFDDLAVRSREAGAQTLIDGQGGDDLLHAAVAGGRELLLRPRALAEWLLSEKRYVSSVRSSIAALAGSFRTREPALPQWLAADLRPELADRLARRPRRYAEIRSADVVDGVLAAQREEAADFASRHGLRHAHPLWDDEVVSLLDGLPPAALVAGGDPKSPARSYLRRRLSEPAGVWPLPAVADNPVRRLLGAGGEAAWRRLGGARRLFELEILDEGLVPGDLALTSFAIILRVESWLRGREHS